MTPRYRLRTLLIVLALGPPVLAGVGYFAYLCSDNGFCDAPLAVLTAAILFAPFWIPVVFFVYAIRRGRLDDAATLATFLIVEAVSAAVSIGLTRVPLP